MSEKDITGQNAEVASAQQETESAPKKSWVRRNLPWVILECIILVLSLGFLYVVVQTTSRVEKVTVNKSHVTINEEVVAQKEKKKETTKGKTAKGIRNIALFGVDSRQGELGKNTRSDTIIIASIDQDNHTVKLISLYRDTYLNVGGDVYTKCNAAYAKGGPEQAMTMLNTNLDLDITDYITVGFEGLSAVIDELGGIEMDVKDSEISHLNNYQLCMAEEMGIDYTAVIESGVQNLNGLQATAYCRIRYTSGDDYKRAERQRTVINRILLKAQTVSLTKLTNAALAVMPNVATSLSIDEIVGVLGSVADYQVVTSEGFPFEGHRVASKIGADGSCIVPVDLATNVSILHEMLYGSEDDYKISSTVQNISAFIKDKTDPYINGTIQLDQEISKDVLEGTDGEDEFMGPEEMEGLEETDPSMQEQLTEESGEQDEADMTESESDGYEDEDDSSEEPAEESEE